MGKRTGLTRDTAAITTAKDSEETEGARTSFLRRRRKEGVSPTYRSIAFNFSTYMHSGGLLSDPNAPRQTKNSLSPNHQVPRVPPPQFISMKIHLPSSMVPREVTRRCAVGNPLRTITNKKRTRTVKLKDRCGRNAVALDVRANSMFAIGYTLEEFSLYAERELIKGSLSQPRCHR
jgi:hypothetical protein